MMRFYILNKILIILIFLCACSTPDTATIEFFKSVYSPDNEQLFVNQSQTLEFKKVSFSAQGITIQDFSVWFAKEFAQGLIFSNVFNDQKLYLELRNASAEDVCNSVARHLNTSFTSLGSTYFIGERQLKELAVYVKKVRGAKVTDLRNIITGLTGDGGAKGNVSDDGIVFLLDTQESLLSFARAFEQLEAINSDAWVVQLYLFDFKETFIQDLGIDLSGSGNLAYKLLADSQKLPIYQLPFDDIIKHSSKSLTGSLTLDALIRASRTNDNIKLINQPLFIMRDGSNFQFKNVEKIPFVKKVATQEGFISDTDVTFIDIGLILNVQLRELKHGNLLNINIENSQILAINDGLPTFSSTTITSETPLAGSGIYLIAQNNFSEKGKTTFIFGSSDSQKSRTLQIFARVFKLSPKFQSIPQN